MIDLSIIIVSWNTKALLKDCLSSVFKQTKGINFEVWIVDNGSTDGSVEFIKERQKKEKRIFLIENNANLGFAKANNQALRRARGKHLLLLNSDTKIVDNALEKMVDFAQSDTSIGIIGPKLLNPDGSPQLSVAPFFTLLRVFVWLFTGDRFLYSSPSKATMADWLMGAALMAKRQMIEEIGGLDETFFMYVEEVDWCHRAKKAGWGVWFYPAAQITHLVRGSSPEGKQRAVLGIYKGLLRFYEKNFASWQLAVLKFLLLAKAGIAWLIGVITGNDYLKKTYGKAIELVGQT